MCSIRNKKIFEIVNYKIQKLYGCKIENLYNTSYTQLRYVREMIIDVFKIHMEVSEISELTKLSSDFIRNTKFSGEEPGLAKIYYIITTNII